jgi:beta-lactamase regulating signal transducer with metallopeptidase domain
MTTLWILYGLGIGVLLGVAALGAEALCRLWGWPVRWVWGGALAAALVLIGLAPLRTQPAGLERVALADLAGVAVVEAAAEPASTARTALTRLEQARQVLGSLASAPLTTAAGWAARSADGAARAVSVALAVGWAVLSVVLFAVFAGSYWRYRSVRRRWPTAVLDDTPVRVAPTAGPAVMGLLRPEIVAPRWLLDAPPEHQRMVLAHEREHLRAGDPQLLVFGCLAAVLLPWNPAVWWMLSRLRLAVELDCDTRVLRHGVRPRAYGTLLLDIAQHQSGLRLGAAALADNPSHLERRLLAMNAPHVRLKLLRGAALAVLGGSALLAACETRMPTAAEIEKMDVAAAETGAQRLSLLSFGENGKVEYRIDGVVADAEAARALAPDDIAHIDVRRESRDGVTTGQISIITKEAIASGRVEAPQKADGERRVLHLRAADGAAQSEGQLQGATIRVRGVGEAGQDSLTAVRWFHADGSQSGPTVQTRNLTISGAAADEPGMLVIDGVRAEPSALRALRPDQIESIEILKGPAATQLYSEPEAARGVIRITTRRAP